MYDITEYWLKIAQDDIPVAKKLLESKDYLWMGFICHLIAEKSLKAVFAEVIKEVPPYDHKLLNLATLSGILPYLSNEQKKLLGRLQPLQIEARYPSHREKIKEGLTDEISKQIFIETEAFLCWIKQWLEKSRQITQIPSDDITTPNK
jgi:HEPN domain-containing protein